MEIDISKRKTDFHLNAKKYEKFHVKNGSHLLDSPNIPVNFQSEFLILLKNIGLAILIFLLTPVALLIKLDSYLDNISARQK
ncbi:MAG: hypothetical protein HY094_01640 [Candidatus Melainabacteria bacterium]|nr:hypothetical protein [Candidatus Melainabacteria bacterium]